MTPKDRDALIEVMARWNFGLQFASQEYADFKWASMLPETRARWLKEEDNRIAALESSGCAVVPVEATEGMVSEFDGLHISPSYFECPPFAETWAAMLSASPYRKE